MIHFAIESSGTILLLLEVSGHENFYFELRASSKSPVQSYLHYFHWSSQHKLNDYNTTIKNGVKYYESNNSNIYFLKSNF